MKTLKLMFVACFVTLTMVSYAQVNVRNILPVIYPKELSICLTLNQAVTMPHLVQAIYAQVNPGFLKYHYDGTYTFIIHVKKVNYSISGSYGDWSKFFRAQPLKKTDGNRIDE